MRGYQKKVIFLKNTGSELFDEAYFIVKYDEDKRFFSHATMVSEAQRIIEENFGRKKKRLKILNPTALLAFFLGFLFSLVLCFVFF